MEQNMQPFQPTFTGSAFRNAGDETGLTFGVYADD
jgi:hypothetical protein